MKKVTLLLNYNELKALYEILKGFKFNETDTSVMAMYIIMKIYQRLFIRVCNHPSSANKQTKFTVKHAEAIALKLVLNDVYTYENNLFNKNVVLRITGSINQQLV